MRIVVVDDHVLFREVLCKACMRELDCEVVGQAGTGQEAKLAALSTKPDLVLLDVHLPDCDGFEVAEFIATQCSASRLLMMSAHCDDYTFFRVEKAAPHGFIDKNTQTLKTLRFAVETIMRGSRYFSETYINAKIARQKNRQDFTRILSEREREILCFIGQSYSDEEIAQKLAIAPTTVQTHRSIIMRKLGIPGTPKLIHFAIQHGLTIVA